VANAATKSIRLPIGSALSAAQQHRGGDASVRRNDREQKESCALRSLRPWRADTTVTTFSFIFGRAKWLNALECIRDAVVLSTTHSNGLSINQGPRNGGVATKCRSAVNAQNTRQSHNLQLYQRRLFFASASYQATPCFENWSPTALVRRNYRRRRRS